MGVKINHDRNAPTASVELMITRPLEDFDLTELEALVPRDVDPMLASQGFKDLLDEARTILEREFKGNGLEIAQLTGAICHDGNVHRPGIWLVVRESNVTGKEMSPTGRTRVAAAAEAVRAGLQIS